MVFGGGTGVHPFSFYTTASPPGAATTVATPPVKHFDWGQRCLGLLLQPVVCLTSSLRDDV